MVSVTHEKNIICIKTHLDRTMHQQTIICRQLLAGHMVGSWPMKRKGKMYQLIIAIIVSYTLLTKSRELVLSILSFGELDIVTAFLSMENYL